MTAENQETMIADVELGTQVTSAYGQGIVTWVEEPIYTVLMFNLSTDMFAPREYRQLAREQIDFWPPRNRQSS